MTGGTPPLLERGNYFLLTPPPPALREPPELEPRDADPREAPLDLPDDEEPTRAVLRPDEEPLERTVEEPEDGFPEDVLEEGPEKVRALDVPPSPKDFGLVMLGDEG